MTEEFYHKNIFGEAVDIDLQEKEGGEAMLLDKKGKEFNIFALADAFGSRDKKRAWVLYQQALLAGVPAERIFFTLVWKVRSMLLLKKNFERELLSERLVIGYHQARRGEGEIETLVEKTILSL